MASQDLPLDEIQWKSTVLAQQMQGVHENSVLHYFSHSPFFDQTSNNAILASQATFNPNLFEVLQTRAAFEGRLKTMSGLEFVIAEQPEEMAPGTGTGIWVIRKQTRRKVPSEEDEITIHSNYFVVGDNIYMASTVADILCNRTMAIISSLNKVATSMTTLPDFSPALGHVYIPPPTSKRGKNVEPQLSRASKENTPLPEPLQASQKPPPAAATIGSNYLDNRVLEEAINASMTYGDDYMDAIPVTGQPGDFHFSSTGREAKDKLMVPGPVKGPLHVPSKTAKPVPAPSPLKTNIPAERKGSKAEKSPKTPGMAKPKRRKSKAVGATPAASPKA
ncbi:uncharacterized protein L3040_008518 [Drepanopeziza brunnea f. sp. 'multigermtubi']|uniref:Mediator of RNA polymerase II transcription subunit 6 n=1 Tax=Marssonina brunnea f. sp. multigermtubi (strain MB_m1) TaxID=1072389 RepID=K1WVC1_MARBU|nr:Mediator of RNA polymerase II transcription subunit 6 [Drepanopeziza brunnea f. sp. 'multigermtubi' MB_m1]EKD16417.1 Mediator of RNA polymerase II transcription subunit 6 [Drepanopeziza brunnea f. sp. 'multigermtubi' MB_m1]KAJ5033401.1 hypothetical protein L3040_008518 [Drepanopeziza brunnea f. sp. 'multigermtubi']